ncbi:MAG TPA: helix-turn-helix domain-containing protein [Solirubrobacteraceae bacterium]|nr:helix-turn-helix domain-containing protein [Solirubrobacteraceae bacterium]
MGRWKPDAPGRLQRAAFELFAERGYEATTVAEIAERAGLTERTFFRHFADKREVLFGGSDELLRLIADAAAAAPDGAAPIEAVAAGLEAAGTVFDASRRPHSRRRQAIIDANPELRERELVKLAGLAAVLGDSLRGRGADETTASIASHAGVALFRFAFERWLADDTERDFAHFVREGVTALGALSAG